MDLTEFIRDIPDFPSPGIRFKDITPLLADGPALAEAVRQMSASWVDGDSVDVVAGIEARGFIFGAAIACHLGVGFVPLRKAGKLPHDVLAQTYDLEYGTAELQVHVDAFADGARVLLVDDVLATGGTAAAAADLVVKAGGRVAGLSFLMELQFLEGGKALEGMDHHSVLSF